MSDLSNLCSCQVEIKLFNEELINKLGCFNTTVVDLHADLEQETLAYAESAVADFNNESYPYTGLLVEPNILSTLHLPYMTPNAGAFDLFAIIEQPITITSFSSPIIIPTGLGIQIAHQNFDFMILLFIRSSLSKHGIRLTNGVGVIDPDYQNQIFCSIVNNDNNEVPYTINPGDRIAQAVLMPVFRMTSGKIVKEFSSATVRSEGGFGSTGVQ